MITSRFIKEHHGYDYADFNHGKTGKQAKRRRKIGNHIIRQHLKRDLRKQMEVYYEMD